MSLPIKPFSFTFFLSLSSVLRLLPPSEKSVLLSVLSVSGISVVTSSVGVEVSCPPPTLFEVFAGFFSVIPVFTSSVAFCRVSTSFDSSSVIELSYTLRSSAFVRGLSSVRFPCATCFLFPLPGVLIGFHLSSFLLAVSACCTLLSALAAFIASAISTFIASSFVMLFLIA